MAGGIEVIYLDLEQLGTYKNENESVFKTSKIFLVEMDIDNKKW